MFRIISLLRTTFTQITEHQEVNLVPACGFHPYVLISLVLRNIFKNKPETTRYNIQMTPFKTGHLQKQSFQTDSLGRFFSLSIIMINSFIMSCLNTYRSLQLSEINQFREIKPGLWMLSFIPDFSELKTIFDVKYK